HDISAASVGVIAYPVAPVFLVGDLFEIQHAVGAHTFGNFQPVGRRADDEHLLGSVVFGDRGGEIAERPAALNHHGLVALDGPEPVETMHYRSVGASRRRRRRGSNIFGNFDDETFFRHVHILSTAVEEKRMLIAAVMSPGRAARAYDRLLLTRVAIASTTGNVTPDDAISTMDWFNEDLG